MNVLYPLNGSLFSDNYDGFEGGIGVIVLIFNSLKIADLRGIRGGFKSFVLNYKHCETY
jgi:hypothetical protein